MHCVGSCCSNDAQHLRCLLIPLQGARSFVLSYGFHLKKLEFVLFLDFPQILQGCVHVCHVFLQRSMFSFLMRYFNVLIVLLLSTVECEMNS